MNKEIVDAALHDKHKADALEMILEKRIKRVDTSGLNAIQRKYCMLRQRRILQTIKSGEVEERIGEQGNRGVMY